MDCDDQNTLRKLHNWRACSYGDIKYCIGMEFFILAILPGNLINSVRPELRACRAVEGRIEHDIDYMAPPLMVRQAHHERRGLIREPLRSIKYSRTDRRQPLF
jgi:hypothetical protein